MISHEQQYLDIIEKLITKGTISKDRTGVGTRSLFGTSMRFNLQNNLPLFTTRRVFFRGAIEELLWMLKGETDTTKLKDKNVNIWNGNTTKEFLLNRGLTYPEGQIGKLYGFQLRNWGGDWQAHLEGKRTGTDQLHKAIETLKTNPTSRRIILSYWNVTDLDEGVLTPCHAFIQFRVNQKKQTLDCMVTQRSADICCGVPINIVFYSVLTMLLAKITNHLPGELVWCGGDTHIYLNHIENAKKQIKRTPYSPPKIEIPHVQTLKDIEQLQYSDFKLNSYNYHLPLKYPMAI